MLNTKELLEEIKASPYKVIEITSPHTGVIEFAGLKPGDSVRGISGEHKEKPGTLLLTITRENNPKTIHAPENGEVLEIQESLAGTFVESGQTLMTIRHFLSRKEVIELILKQALFLFEAPERAKYYFSPELDKKLKVSGKRSVRVKSGMELFIVSRMKRESPLTYAGPDGIIYAVYFHRGDAVDPGQPLIGVCPEDQLTMIQEVVARVQSEWEEQ
ncbi:MAG: biotin attachment protein [Proteobacteria bacterium]|nr:biotin attachment protein [Pseudomonadota bacterium]MBU1611367.1 biotin attachment protein [Pseudomonadota bacterium]